jgi:hypothetical protein
LALPICIELVANPPPEGVLAQTLVDSCTGAAGASGCVLYPNCSAAASVRVRVSFEAGYARVLVELVSESRRPEAREIIFRDDDPPLERFRATGLVVAGRVPGLRIRPKIPGPASAQTADDTAAAVSDSPNDASVAEPPPLAAITPNASTSPEAQESGSEAGPVWSAAAVFDLGFVEPGVGVRFAVDVPLGNKRRYLPFATLSVAHEQTLHRDVYGVSEQHQTLGAGGGIMLPLVERRWTFRLPLQAEVEQLRAAVVQPNSGRQDAGSRVLFALALGADVVWSFSNRFGAFAGALMTWTSERTEIRVGSQPVTAIAPVQLSSAVGLNVRIP